jgi:hypothetical protein
MKLKKIFPSKKQRDFIVCERLIFFALGFVSCVLIIVAMLIFNFF